MFCFRFKNSCSQKTLLYLVIRKKFSLNRLYYYLFYNIKTFFFLEYIVDE